jgi:hypothetical protein
MISFWISAVATGDRLGAAEPSELTIVTESRGLVFPLVQAGSIGSARAAAFAWCDLGGDHPPGDRLTAWQLSGPRRGPDDHTEPAAADIPAVDTDVDTISSSRHSCHRSSLCTMPATTARWGRVPASRRTAISTSAGVRTLTTTAGHARRSMATVAGGRGRLPMRWQPHHDRHVMPRLAGPPETSDKPHKNPTSTRPGPAPTGIPRT